MKKRISKKEVSLFQDKLFCMYYLYTTNSKTQSNTDQFLYGFPHWTHCMYWGGGGLMRHSSLSILKASKLFLPYYATELMGITMSLGPVKIRIFPCQSVGDCLFIYF